MISNYVALLFLVIGIFLILAMAWDDYKDAKYDRENPDKKIYRDGASGAIVILFGLILVGIAIVIKLLN